MKAGSQFYLESELSELNKELVIKQAENERLRDIAEDARKGQEAIQSEIERLRVEVDKGGREWSDLRDMYDNEVAANRALRSRLEGAVDYIEDCQCAPPIESVLIAKLRGES